MKRIVLLLVLVCMIFTVSCGKNEYVYSHITTHENTSSLSGVAVEFDKFCKNTYCLIEFTVSGDYTTKEYSYVDQRAVDAAIAEGLTGEDLEREKAFATLDMNLIGVPIKIEDVIFEDDNANVLENDTIWLVGDLSKHAESFPENSRFVAFAVMNDSEIPIDFMVTNNCLFYIDENECLVPFFEDQLFNGFVGISLEEFKAKAIEARTENAE